MRAAAFGLVASILLAGPAMAESTSQGAQKPELQTTPAAPQWAQPFAPAVGSRWRVEVTTTASDDGGPAPQKGRLTQRYDLTYAAREGAGYRVILVLRETALEGNIGSLQLAATALAPFRNLTVDGVTDATGLPVRVLNEAQVRATVSGYGERMMADVANKPQMVPLVRLALAVMLEPRGVEAAAAWLDPLPILASAQNTVLKPGQVDRLAGTMPNPLGGSVATQTVMQLAPDGRPDRFTLIFTDTIDPDAIKAATRDVVGQFGAPPGHTANASPKETEQMLARIGLDIRQTQRIDVEGGMARRALTDQTIRASIRGRAVTRTKTSLVTVTPAP